MKRFREYFSGRHFTLDTEQKPLVSIVSPKNGIPTMTAARLQKRWALIVSEYSHDIAYRSGSEIPHADALSRLQYDDPAKPGEMQLMDVWQETLTTENYGLKYV